MHAHTAYTQQKDEQERERGNQTAGVTYTIQPQWKVLIHTSDKTSYLSGTSTYLTYVNIYLLNFWRKYTIMAHYHAGPFGMAVTATQAVIYTNPSVQSQ